VQAALRRPLGEFPWHDGTATLEAAHDFKRMQDPKVLELRKRVQLIGDDGLERALPSRQAIVEVTLRNGRVLRHHTKEVRGTSQNPMTREEVGEKAFGLCAPVLDPKQSSGCPRSTIDCVAEVSSFLTEIKLDWPFFYHSKSHSSGYTV
jgi:2-methylcitrate dehydratase PrpD